LLQAGKPGTTGALNMIELNRSFAELQYLALASLQYNGVSLTAGQSITTNDNA